MKRKNLPCGRHFPQGKTMDIDPKRGALLLNRLLKKLQSFVDDKGLNQSKARTKILKIIVKEARHFCAQDLLERLRKKHPEVGKATLYRNLPILVESGLIQEGPTDAGGNTLYELTDESHHDHIVCTDCKRIFEFHDVSIEKEQTQLSKKMGFTLHNHSHVIYASCDFLKK